ncbi:protein DETOXIFICATION 16-like isoform X2 [Bidens hawaiensis]|uniref:protein DETOXIFICATION 16-like isoform X2 n=1 Tax=Bidens hawaiensis TaxID=980011 RepID=UPI004048F2B8
MDQEQYSKPLLESSSKHVLEFDAHDIFVELKLQLMLAGPFIVVSFLQYSFLLTSIMFVGHLGELALSGASLATSFANVTGFCFMMGIGGALETLCGQAYGAKHYQMLGIHLQRAMAVLMLICIPISIIWAFTGQILTIFGQDSEISKQAGNYAHWLIPSIFPYGLLQCQTRFLQTQKNLKPLMLSTGFASLFHVGCCWLLVSKLGFGSSGAALSVAISYAVNVAILCLYIKMSRTCVRTWVGFSKEGVDDLGGVLALGVPSALMVCLEFWAYEVIVLLSGLLPNPKLETSMMSISLSTISLAYRIPFGFGSTVSTRVSNELGAGKHESAKLAVWVALSLVITEVLVVGLALVAARGVWAKLYTNEAEVVSYVSLVIPVLAISNVMDGVQGVLSGVARGCGWQKMGTLVNLGAYYLVGLPCAIALTFVYNFGGKAKKAMHMVHSSTIPTTIAVS